MEAYTTTGKIGIVVAYVLLVFWAVISLLPLYWVFVTALQLPDEVFSIPPSFVPTMVKKYIPLLLTGRAEEANDILRESFSTLVRLFRFNRVGRWIFNSAYISTVCTLGVLFLDSMAGYVFAKKEFPGKTIIFWMIIATMMIPGQVTLVPMFMIIRNLGMMGTHWAVILPPLSMVFGVFLMRQFISSIPTSLIEAAHIDGATEFGIYWRVILPLTKPALAALGIFTFMSVWNSFLWPIIVLSKAPLYTLPVGLKTLQDQNLADYQLLMNGAAVAAIPMIIVFLLFQRYFIKGLTLGGVKG